MAAVTGVTSAPSDILYDGDADNSTEVLQARQTMGNSEGYPNGYFYSWWSDDGGYAQYTMGAGGQCAVQWKDTGSVIGGHGLEPRQWPVRLHSKPRTHGNHY